jgi:hypothetical protein
VLRAGQTLFEGAVLAVIIVFLFLRDLRTARLEIALARDDEDRRIGCVLRPLARKGDDTSVKELISLLAGKDDSIARAAGNAR